MGWVQIRRMFIQQSLCTGMEAAGQSAGSGSGGLVSSPWGQQEEQVMCWVQLISQDVMHSQQTMEWTGQ